MPRIYLAGPLFTAAERHFNEQIDRYLRDKGYEVFLPQRECENKQEREIYQTCLHGLQSSAIVVAILDGADADSGTCWECGYAVASGLPAIAVRTDIRQSGDTRGFNAMLYYSASAIVERGDDCLAAIEAAIRAVAES